MEYGIFFSIFLVGLSYGMTACMMSCMPFLTPLLVKNSGSMQESMSVMIPFSLGRIFTYTVIAVIATAGAGTVKMLLQDNQAVNYLLGLLTIVIGMYMLANTLWGKKKNCSFHKPVEKNSKITHLGFFSIGAFVSINLCVPVVTLVSLAANSTSYMHSVGLGLSFGLGAVLFSFLFYGFFMSHLIRGLLEQFKTYTKAVEITASLFLIMIGVFILSGKLSF